MVLDRISPSGIHIPLGAAQLFVLTADASSEAVSIAAGATGSIQVPMTTGLLTDRVIDLLPPDLSTVGGDIFFGLPVFADIGAGVIAAFITMHNNGATAQSIDAGIWTSLVLR